MIASERLTAYKRWSLQDFQATESPPVHPQTLLRPVAEVPLPPAAECSEPLATFSIKLPTAEEIEQIQNQAHKEGFDDGYDQGIARVRMEAMHLHSLIENIENAFSTLDQQVAEELLQLSVELARQLVRQVLAIKPAVVLASVREALQQVPQQSSVIHLHPDDARLVRANLTEQLDQSGHRIFEDVTLTRGGCRIESAGTDIDATIETRWRRIVESIGANSNWIDAATPDWPMAQGKEAGWHDQRCA